jgi:protein-S-isoprenylcysteine O-methyltransferase Ste14
VGEWEVTLLPELKLGILNGWIFLVTYGGGLLIALATFSKDEKARVFADPKQHLRGFKRVALHFGQLVAITFIVLMVFTPITYTIGLLVVGVGVYILGYGMVMIALQYFKQETDDRPVVDGPYRFSRNPQWVGLFLVLLGSAIASGAWLLILMVLVVGVIYHLQILEEEKACKALYGEAYQRYLGQVARYFVWF